MAITRGDLESVIKDGLVQDIFRLERAESILKAIGLRATEINNGPGNFGELFGAFQAALTTEAVLSIARIFDTPDKKYPTRCIRGVLNYLREHQTHLQTIQQPHQVKTSLRTMSAPDHLMECVDTTPEKFSANFPDFVHSILEQPKRKTNLSKLKKFRDKSLAHNEHVTAIDPPVWKAIANLTDLAKQTVGVLGWAYLNTAYMANGTYLFTNDARSSEIDLNRLLKQLYGAQRVP